MNKLPVTDINPYIIKIKELEKRIKELESMNVEVKSHQENYDISEDKPYIYERNSDTGEIFRRKKGDYTNKECINPAVNSVPNIT